MSLFEIDKNVISGQCYGALARIQIGYKAIFILTNILPNGWQGLQFGIFAPAHNPSIGYERIKFYYSLLPALKGPALKWPKWYVWIHRKLQFKLTLKNGFV